MKKITYRILLCFFIATQVVPMNLWASNEKAVRGKKFFKKKKPYCCGFFSIFLPSMLLLFINRPQASSTNLPAPTEVNKSLPPCPQNNQQKGNPLYLIENQQPEEKTLTGDSILINNKLKLVTPLDYDIANNKKAIKEFLSNEHERNALFSWREEIEEPAHDENLKFLWTKKFNGGTLLHELAKGGSDYCNPKVASLLIEVASIALGRVVKNTLEAVLKQFPADLINIITLYTLNLATHLMDAKGCTAAYYAIGNANHLYIQLSESIKFVEFKNNRLNPPDKETRKWRIMHPGINVEGKCDNRQCPAYQKLVWADLNNEVMRDSTRYKKGDLKPLKRFKGNINAEDMLDNYLSVAHLRSKCYCPACKHRIMSKSVQQIGFYQCRYDIEIVFDSSKFISSKFNAPDFKRRSGNRIVIRDRIDDPLNHKEKGYASFSFRKIQEDEIPWTGMVAVIRPLVNQNQITH